MHEIIPGLFLGNRNAAGSSSPQNKKETLKSHGVTHILCVSTISHHYFPTDFTYFFLPISQSEDEKIEKHLDKAFEYIEKALSKNEAILIHCEAGVSRSASVVIGYLMKKYHYSYETAFQIVAEKRPFIQPGQHFENQLRKLDFTL